MESYKKRLIIATVLLQSSLTFAGGIVYKGEFKTWRHSRLLAQTLPIVQEKLSAHLTSQYGCTDLDVSVQQIDKGPRIRNIFEVKVSGECETDALDIQLNFTIPGPRTVQSYMTVKTVDQNFEESEDKVAIDFHDPRDKN